MKSIQFIYEDTEIHFLVNPDQDHVMVNATEMAKVFGKRVDHFMKSDHAKTFIQVMEKEIICPPNGGQIIENRGRNGIYFHRILALKFAAWLDPKFEFWVFSTLDELMFGHYKQHYQAHARQEAAKIKMEALKERMLLSPTPEMVASYFEAEERFKSAKNDKVRAIRNQLSLFDKEEN